MKYFNYKMKSIDKDKNVLTIVNKYGVHEYPANCLVKFQDGKVYRVDDNGTLTKVKDVEV